MKLIPLDIKIIGIIHSPFKTTTEVPFKGNTEIMTIEVDHSFVEGLTDIDEFSHLHIFYWLHLSKGYKTIVQTPWEDTPHGLFTTRSPHRPNPLGYSVVKLLKRENNLLYIQGLDAIDGTPVIDIKPYIPKRDAQPKAKPGWLQHMRL